MKHFTISIFTSVISLILVGNTVGQDQTAHNGVSPASSEKPPKGIETQLEPDWDAIARDAEQAWDALDEELEKLREKYHPDPNKKPNYGPEDLAILEMLKSYERIMEAEKFIKDLNKKQEQVFTRQHPLEPIPPPDLNLPDLDLDQYLEDIEKLAERVEFEQFKFDSSGNIQKAQKSSEELFDAEMDKIVNSQLENLLKAIGNFAQALTPLKEKSTTPTLNEIPDGSSIEPPKEPTKVVSAKGTGRTTGHIATLTVKNNTDKPVKIMAQQVYIPSDGKHQSYVGEVPESMIPPGATVPIPVNGYCADVHSPPFGPGVDMTPSKDWRPVGISPTGADGISLFPRPSLPTFTLADIPRVTGSTAFTPKPESTLPLPGGIRPTWPGTNFLVGGTIHQIKDPDKVAPVIVQTLNLITQAFDKLKGEGEISTPFSPDPTKERESVIQQTFWISMGAITGEDYQEEDFEANVFEQFEEVTGVSVNTLPVPEKENLTSGVEIFWTVFVATGVEAKVLSEPVSSSEDQGTTLVQDETEEKEKQKGDCACDKMELFVGINIERKAENMISEADRNHIVPFEKGKSDATLSEIKARASNVEQGKKVEVTVTTKLICTCSVEASDCPQTREETIKIMYGKEELKESFALGKIPYKIKITVTRACESEDCTKKICTVTVPVSIEKESLKDKKKREEKEAAKKAEEAKKKK